MRRLRQYNNVTGDAGDIDNDVSKASMHVRRGLRGENVS